MRTFFTNIPSRLLLYILPLALTVLLELLSRRNTQEFTDWIAAHPLAFLLGYFVVGALYLLLIAITGRSRLSLWLLGAVTIPLAIFSGSKLTAIGAPYYPWDLIFHNEIMEYRKFVGAFLSWRIAGYIALFVLLLVVLLHVALAGRRAPRFRWIERAVYAVVAVVLLVSVQSNKPVPFQDMYGIYTVPWDHTLTYDADGFVLSSTMLTHYLNVDKPSGYNRQAINRIMDAIPATQAAHAQNPNIIVMLSESFWDPTVMTNVSFSRDPIPFLHSLQKTYTSGKMLSPEFGGSTANVEFEVLTGNSMRFLPPGSLAYIEYMNHGVDSLASIMTRQGYTATAINPFFSWFFDSRKVYRDMGFARFISSEFFPNDFEGPNYADRAVARTIIETTESTAGPDFVFANTMENHQPYWPGKFAKNTIEVSGPITAESKGLLETYAQGISDADKCLQTLVEYYKQRNEPTILLFFGDHLPFLEDDYKVYRDAGYVVGDDPALLTKVHDTPFVIWNNFLPKEAEKPGLHLSPSFLGPYVLSLAGKPGSYYTDFLYNQMQKTPILPPRKDWPAYGIHEEDVADYAKLEYDNLFGSRFGYAAKGYKYSIVQPDFTLGYGNPVIATAELDEDEVRVKGTRFFYSCTIYVDGQPLKTSFNGTDTLYGELPEDGLLSGQPHRIEVRIIDDKQMQIGQSNIVTVP